MDVAASEGPQREPSGWQPPRERPRLRRALTMLGIGLVVGIALAYGSAELVAAAWRECGDVGGGAGFSLAFGYAPLVTWVCATAFATVALALSRWSVVVGLGAGVAVATLLTVALVAQAVPAYPAADYANGHSSRANAACGPNGIPTWWPWWLPS